jgi:hypothetical protein
MPNSIGNKMKNVPESLRHIRLLLAREKGHPVGDTDHGYDIVAPLTQDGHIDAEVFKKCKDVCRVRRFRPHEEDAIGKLHHGPGGRWFFDYNDATTSDDEAGFRFSEEKFVIGEYVSIQEDDGIFHTFAVTKVQPV